MRLLNACIVFALFVLVSGCVPTFQGAGAASQTPLLSDNRFLTSDNTSLAVRSWGQDIATPRAVIVAVHGFNDYSNAFTEPATFWEQQNIITYAYDQRGFGDSGKRGTWAGTETYVRDLKEICAALRQRYPNTPLYVLGESMGGAVSIVAFTDDTAPTADGVILAAPAVWARSTMPMYQRIALYLGARLIPWASFTGEGLDVVASDNRDMLIALGRDPKVIKDTKVAAMYGLTNLMDTALERSSLLNQRALILIGERDEIVPNQASAVMLKQLPPDGKNRREIALYQNGYHMLLRDLDGITVWEDVAAWLQAPEKTFPFAETQARLESWIDEKIK